MDNIEDLEEKIEHLKKRLANQKEDYKKVFAQEAGYYDAKIILRTAKNTENELRETIRRYNIMRKG